MKTHLKKSAKVTKSIFQIQLTLLILAILPLAVFTLLTSKSTFLLGIRSMVVLSGSMEPSIGTGGVVYVQPASTYSKGEVISFTTESGMTVTHRIVEVTKNSDGIAYRTKGDANSVQDSELVPHKNVIGKSIFSVPYLGYIINWLKTPQGFVFAVILPTIIFIGMELWTIKKEIEKSVEKRVMERLNAT